MDINSTLVTSLPSSISPGSGLSIPEICLPIISIPLPVAAVATAGTINMSGTGRSVLASRNVNQGASTGASNTTVIIFDKGVYRFVGMLGAVVLGGLAPSSAAPVAAQAGFYTPGDTAFCPVSQVGYDGAGTPFQDKFDVTVQFTQNGWSFRIVNPISTGVGQSIGVYCTCYMSQLL